MTTDTVGGVWSFTLDLSEALAPHGINVVAAAFGGPCSEQQRAEAARVSNLQVLESGFKLEWMDDPWHDIECSGRWLLDLEEQYAPDVVHLNSYGHGSLPWHSRVVLTAHSCVLSWWSAVKDTPLPRTWERYRMEVEYALKAADVLTAPSHAMKRAIETHYGSDLPATRVVHNGRNHARYRPAAKENFVLTAGRVWDEGKNIAALARVAHKLDWPVYVAGESRDTDLHGCIALGRLSADGMAEWHGRASIFALPALYEPFGLSPLEAALSGCALVLGDLPSLREVWGDAAIFVNPRDASELESAIQGLIRDASLRNTMSERAKERAREYSADRMAAAYLEVYCAS